LKAASPVPPTDLSAIENELRPLLEGLHSARVEHAVMCRQHLIEWFGTERNLHMAWRKRAEEAEAREAASPVPPSALLAKLQRLIGDPGIFGLPIPPTAEEIADWGDDYATHVDVDSSAEDVARALDKYLSDLITEASSVPSGLQPKAEP
jgi:hypothetical protein